MTYPYQMEVEAALAYANSPGPVSPALVVRGFNVNESILHTLPPPPYVMARGHLCWGDRPLYILVHRDDEPDDGLVLALERFYRAAQAGRLTTETTTASNPYDFLDLSDSDG